MSITKTKISVTISKVLADLLEETAKKMQVPKSSLVEDALKPLMEKRLEADAKTLSSLSSGDLPSEDEWNSIQSEW